MGIAALVVAVVALVIVVSIHSEMRHILGRINAIIDTLPGAPDAMRLIDDIERTGEQRGHVVCDSLKNTHISWYMAIPSPLIPSRNKLKNEIWRGIRRFTNWWSGDIYKSPELTPRPKRWKLQSASVENAEAEELLAKGWEPFSVTSDNKLWVRKALEVAEEKVNS